MLLKLLYGTKLRILIYILFVHVYDTRIVAMSFVLHFQP